MSGKWWPVKPAKSLPPRPPLPKAAGRRPDSWASEQGEPPAQSWDWLRRLVGFWVKLALLAALVVGLFWAARQPFAQGYVDSLKALAQQAINYIKQFL